MEMMIDKNIARADAYKLLAECFYKPQTKWFEKKGLLQNLNEVLEFLHPECELYIKIVSPLKTKMEELIVEYARLFIGPFQLQAPPYGSYYLDGENKLMGDSTIAVRNMYARFGLELTETIKEVPDHIAIELEFLHYLAYKENEARNANDAALEAELFEAQQEFLKNYLNNFVQQMCEKILSETNNSFYSSLAECLKCFIQRDFLRNYSNN